MAGIDAVIDDLFPVLSGVFVGFMLANVMLRPLRLEAKKALLIGDDEALNAVAALVEAAGGKVTVRTDLLLTAQDRLDVEMWDDPVTRRTTFQTRRKVVR